MFDAGAIVSKLTLDKKPFDASMKSVQQGTEQMKSRWQGMTESFKKNWLAATAAITAAIMALRKAFQLIELGARAEQIEQSFRAMANSVGISADKMRKGIMAATAETVNFSNVAGQASALMAAGLGMEEVGNLFERARALARIFGQDTEQAVQVLTSAITGQLVTTLRRTYGLSVSLADAVTNYAKATGKTAEEVQKLYMSQAVYNEILRASEGHMKAVNLEIMTSYEQIQKLKSGWQSFTEALGLFLLKVFNIIRSLFTMVSSGIMQLIEWVMMGLTKFLEATENLVRIYERFPIIGERFRGLADSIRQTSDATRLWAEQARLAGDNLTEETLDTWHSVFGQVKDGAEDTGQYLLDAMRATAEGVKDIGEDITQTFNYMEEFGKQAARNIQDAFGEFFFKAFKGELTTLGDIFESFFDSMMQMFSQLLAKALLMKMLGSIMLPGGHTLAGFLGFQSGTESVPYTGLYKLHAGEKVVPRYDAQKEQAQSVTIHNLITPEAVVMAMAGREGEGVVVNIIDRNALRGGAVQRTIRRG